MKRPVIDDEMLEGEIQKFANDNSNGNFTLAVSILIRSALLVNNIANSKEERLREVQK